MEGGNNQPEEFKATEEVQMNDHSTPSPNLNNMRRVKVKQMGGSDFEIVVPKDVSIGDK